MADNEEEEKVGNESTTVFISYYQKSILSILESVMEIHNNILLPQELDLLKLLISLPTDPQKLFFRLILRRNGWIRVCSLNYSDIENVIAAVERLKESSLLMEELEDVDEILSLLKLEELKFIGKAMGIKITGKGRNEVISLILATRHSNQRRLNFFTDPNRKSIAEEAKERIITMANKFLGSVVRISAELYENIHKIMALFFLESPNATEGDSNYGISKLSTAILVDLNRVKYPAYSIVRSGPIFKSREVWLQFCEAKRQEATISEILIEGVDLDMIEDLTESILESWQKHFESGVQIESYFLRRYSAAWTFTRILSSLVSAWEKLKKFDRANQLLSMLLSQIDFCRGYRGRWWERLVLNLHSHLNSAETALRECKAGLKDEYVRSGSRLSLQRRLHKLSGNGKEEPFELDELPPIIEIFADPEVNSRGGKKLIYLLPGNVPGSVEEYALSHFAEEGWEGVHCESGLYRFIFLLCFWDIIFGDGTEDTIVSDVFQTPFQAAPLDLMTDAFYLTRYERIQSRLQVICEEGGTTAAQLLVNAYYPNYGSQALGAKWEEYPLSLLLDVVHTLGGPTLAALLSPLAEDYANSSTGMPDLFIYRADRSDYRLVEVKSTRDRLSDGQRNWNALFRQAGVKVLLCRVLDTSIQDTAKRRKR